jgi:hypothetical protein
MTKKMITVKGKDFKKVASYIQTAFIKLKQANFPLVFEDKFQMINEDFLVKEFALRPNSSEFLHV